MQAAKHGYHPTADGKQVNKQTISNDIGEGQKRKRNMSLLSLGHSEDTCDVLKMAGKR